MTYYVGQQLELDVKGLFTNRNGDQYIAVYDDNYEYRIFDFIKCQLEGELPARLYVYVKSIDAMGRAKMRQDTQRVYEEYYEKGKEYKFVVEAIKQDNNNHPYYAVSDDFSEQWFYIHGEQKYGVGDTIWLRSLGRKDGTGYMQYEDVIPQAQQPIVQDITTGQRNIQPPSNRVNYGPEGITLEYKSSLVYDAATSTPDIEKQSKLIVKEIVAMMNTEGGKLVIGVRDNQEICGIQNDLPYLNDDETDTFTYPENEDGFKQKILHKINYHCPRLAGNSIKFDFKEKVGLRYCVISIEKAARPVWIKDGKNYELYERQDGRMKRINGDMITDFIYKRLRQTMEMAAGGTQALSQLSTEQLETTLRRILNENQNNVILPDIPAREIDWWIVWMKDGSWKRQHDQSQEKDVAIQTPLYSDMNKPIVLICYDDNKVVARDYKVMNYKTHQNTLNPSEWKNGSTPKNIFIEEGTNYLCVHSVDFNGIEYVKLHVISDFNTVKGRGTDGSPVLPAGYQVKEYGIISSEWKTRLQHLIVKKVERTQNAGIPTNTLNKDLADEVAHALALLEQSKK